MVLCFFSVSELAAQDCEINFDLFGVDTLCNTSDPFPLPPVLPLGGTYSGTNVVDGVFDPEGLEPGEYVLTYTVDSETCVGSDEVIMTVIQGQGVQIVGDLEICVGDTAKITSEPSVELTWYDGTKSYFRDFILDTTFVSSATGLDLVGCPFTQEFTIRVYGLPDSVAITGTTAVCPGGEATLSINTESFFVWFNESSDPTITFTVNEPSEYTVTIYPGADCDTTISYFVDVVPLPEPLIEADTAICAGDSVVITFSGADYFKDQFGTITSPYTVYPLSNFTYFIEAYNSEDCFVTIPVEIIVSEYPIVELSALDEICAGENLVIQVDGGEYYTWVDLDTGQDITQDIDSIYFGFPADTLRVELTAHSLAECNTVIPIEVPVNPIPQPSIEVINPFCEGEIVTLLASGADSFLWSTGVQDSLLEFVGEDDFTLTLYGLNNTGCEDSLVLDVVIHPVPIVSGTGVLSFCEGLSTELVGNGADYYIWNGVYEGDTLVTAPAQDTIINLVGYTEFGCNDFTNININVDPAPDVFISGESEICFGDHVQLNIASDGNVLWSDGSDELYIEFTPLADTALSLISTGQNGCTTPVEIQIIVHPLPEVLISGNSVVCEGENTELLASGASTYVWNTNQNTAQIAIIPYASFVYQVTGTSEEGCISEAEFPLTVHPSPYAYFEFGEDVVCDLGPSLTWVANPSGGVLSGDGVVNNMFNPMNAEVGMNTVTYTVTNEFNCTASDSDEVMVDDCTVLSESGTPFYSVFPNPAKDFAYVSVGEFCHVALVNATGAVLRQMKVSGPCVFDLSDVATGIYVMKMQFEDGKEKTVKLIVE